MPGLWPRIKFSFTSGPHCVRPLHHDLPVLGGPTQHGLVSFSYTRLWSVTSSSREELPEVRGGGREEQSHLQGAVSALAQEGLEELFHIPGQEGRQ